MIDTPSLAEMMQDIGKKARRAALELSIAHPATKIKALLAVADAYEANEARIIAENEKDLAKAESNGLSKAAIDRLMLNSKRIAGVASALREIANLPDPVGEIENVKIRPNGLRIGQMRSPIGVVGIIYESRPNVTADAGALCVKSGNAAILRGGSEAFHSNSILAELMEVAMKEAGLPDNCVQFIPTTDRAAVGELLKMKKYVDIIIPRGGKPLIERVSKESEIPVIKHLDGNCHVYVDASADLAMAEEIILNSKAQRTGVCNAAESLLVHKDVAKQFLRKAGKRLRDAGVELRACERSLPLIDGAIPATEEDWDTEYLDMILAVRTVDSFEEAVAFINEHGSHHTESIVTKDHDNAMRFLRAIDSSCVHINCSTRFSDGGEYGLGAEIGISTDKLHARGPMGLRELTTPKWIVFGEGQIRT